MPTSDIQALRHVPNLPILYQEYLFICTSTAFCSPTPRDAYRVSYLSYTDNNVFSFGSVAIRVLMGIANGLSAVCDVVIVAALCYYLHSKRTGFRRYVSGQ